MHDRKLNDEGGRLGALKRYEILDTAREEPFDRLTELVRTVLGVPIAAVSMIDSERQWFKSITGFFAEETARQVSFCTHTITQRSPFIVPDARLDPIFAKNPLVTNEPWIRSYLGIPLGTPDGYNLGALCAIDTKPRSFPESEVAILTSFAKLVLNELELRQIAMSDGLTGAMTRRAWIDAAGKEIARNRRHGGESSIIIFDIDHFKKVNDVYGHPAGDAVLKAIVLRCVGKLRECDFLGRIGGEEFALLLPETPAIGAVELAERIRRSFEASSVDVNGTALKVTASFGVAPLDSTNNKVDDWLAAADFALYEAKRTGRNRCCIGVAVC